MAVLERILFLLARQEHLDAQVGRVVGRQCRAERVQEQVRKTAEDAQSPRPPFSVSTTVVVIAAITFQYAADKHEPRRRPPPFQFLQALPGAPLPPGEGAVRQQPSKLRRRRSMPRLLGGREGIGREESRGQGLGGEFERCSGRSSSSVAVFEDIAHVVETTEQIGGRHTPALDAPHRLPRVRGGCVPESHLGVGRGPIGVQNGRREGRLRVRRLR
mmetsp:Transcript_51585/g.154868  ORF Transcript_51585/g.154868 Transcript_51585/m.154868 type:complete len:216 (+) Transcript_51585:2101-2748(+)